MDKGAWLLLDGRKIPAKWDGEKWVPLEEVPQVVETVEAPEEIAED